MLTSPQIIDRRPASKLDLCNAEDCREPAVTVVTLLPFAGSCHFCGAEVSLCSTHAKAATVEMHELVHQMFLDLFTAPNR